MTSKPKGEGKTSAEAEGQTPKEDLTFTQKQQKLVDDLVAKAKGDTLTDYRRLETEFRRSQSIADAAIKRLSAIEEEQLRREEDAVRDDPDKLSALTIRRDALRVKADADDRERRSQEKETELQTREQKILKLHADRLAERYNVDTTVLLKYGGGSEDSLEELAKSFGGRTEEGEPKTRMTEQPESSKTKGIGGGKLTRKSLEEYDTTKKTTQEILADARDVLEKFNK